ncbi:hypothetical protein PAMP_013369 [Pampus punctatissimus]
MRFLVFVFLAVAAFHSALSASLESEEKEEKVVSHDQMEFEAAQKGEANHINVTEEKNEDGRYLGEGNQKTFDLHVKLIMALLGSVGNAIFHILSIQRLLKMDLNQSLSPLRKQKRKPVRIQPKNKMYWSEKEQQQIS